MADSPPIRADTIAGLLACRHSKDVIVFECKTGPTHYAGAFSKGRHGVGVMDAWVMAKSWANPCVTVHEIKVSRRDFIGDDKWRGYLPFCNQFYFAVAPGVVNEGEVPDEAGLLVTSKTGGRLFTKKKAPYRDIPIADDVFRYILMCRTVITRDYGVDNREYWQSWLEDKEEKRKTGREVSQAIQKLAGQRIDEIERENTKLKNRMSKYDSIAAVLKRMEIDIDRVSIWETDYTMEGRIKRMREAFPKGFERDVSVAHDHLGRVLKRIQDAKQPDDVGDDISL